MVWPKVRRRAQDIFFCMFQKKHYISDLEKKIGRSANGGGRSAL